MSIEHETRVYTGGTFQVEGILEPVEAAVLKQARERIAELIQQADSFRMGKLKAAHEQARRLFNAKPSQETLALLANAVSTINERNENDAQFRELRNSAQKLVRVYFRDHAARHLARVINRAIQRYESEIEDELDRQKAWLEYYGVGGVQSPIATYLRERVRFFKEALEAVESETKWGRLPPDIDEILGRIGLTLPPEDGMDSAVNPCRPPGELSETLAPV